LFQTPQIAHMASALDLSRFYRFEPLQIVGLARLPGDRSSTSRAAAISPALVHSISLAMIIRCNPKTKRKATP
jgi:hypothetical protein